jgi:Ca2+-binding RTX toxin-like protein
MDLGRWLLLAITGAACSTAPALGDAEQELQLGAFRTQIRNRALVISGNATAGRVALRLQTAEILDVDVGDDGVADASFDRSRFESIVIDAGSGDDLVRIDEVNGAFTGEELTTIMGGGGDDRLIGGAGAETFFGGAGNDDVKAGRGEDVVYLGDGDDRFTWDPGEGSDLVEGEAGTDLMVFFGAGAAERIELVADGDRLRFLRDVGGIVMDLAGLEEIDFAARGGADTVVVTDMAGTGLARLDVDLSAAAGAPLGDGAADAIIVVAPSDASLVDATAEGALVMTSGLAAEVRVTGGDPTLDRLTLSGGARLSVNGLPYADTISLFDSGGGVGVLVEGFNVFIEASGTAALAVNGLAGDDRITGVRGLATIPIQIDGGDGNDVIAGGDGAEVLLGGAGDDTIDGGLGADTAFLGGDDDTFIWSPGGGSDLVEGEEGADVLLFVGTGAAEKIDVTAAGARTRVARDLGSVVMDVDGCERVEVAARGGADRVSVSELLGTAVTRVGVDLATNPGTGLPDLDADVVLIDRGTAGATGVASAGSEVVATGLAAEVRVTGGDPVADRMTVLGGELLSVNGADGGDVMALFDAGGTVGVSVVGFNVFVEAGGPAKLAVNGLGGDDAITGVRGAATLPIQLDGGDGNDVINGGDGAELLLAGPGNDRVDGGLGADTAFLGEGDDTFIWSPGGGSDVVEGEGGGDLLLFIGAGAGERVELLADGGRLRFTRDLGGIVMDVDGVEGVEFDARGGADTVTVADLAGTDVVRVDVDLATNPGDVAGDGQPDVVTVLGTAGADTVDVTAVGRAAFVSGLAAQVRVIAPDATDQLIVNGLGGVDELAAGPGLDALLLLTLLQD